MKFNDSFFLKIIFWIWLFKIFVSFNSPAQHNFKNSSLLSEGLWFKFGITSDGVYSLRGSELTQWQIPIIGKPILTIRLFGHGGKMLYERSDSTPVDDVHEIPIEVQDANNNGFFDHEDKILFYGKGTIQWNKDNSCLGFMHVTNIYTDTAYYFLNFGGNISGLRISAKPALSDDADTIINTFEDFILLEKDSVNLIRSGRSWYWRRFDVINQHHFGLNIQNRTSRPLIIKSVITERCLTAPGNLILKINGVFALQHIPSVVSSHYEGPIAAQDVRCGEFNASGDNILITLQKADQNCETAWLDYIEILAERLILKENGKQLIIRHSASLGKNRVDYQIGGNTQVLNIWNVTRPEFPEKAIIQSNLLKTLVNNKLQEFVLFTDDETIIPTYFGQIANQNLHAIEPTDLIIITPPDFKSVAVRLAEFRNSFDSLSSMVITTNEIYNEFSHGQQDITAIRNFLQLFYNRSLNGAKMPRYVLLFGDASYDYKTHLNRTYRLQGQNRVNINGNFVPTYQTINSLSRNGSSYGSDEFFAFLKPGTGLWETGTYGGAQQDISVGRITISSLQEAEDIVDKIIAYSADPRSLRPWRNENLFVADDMDDSWEDIFVYTSEDMSHILKNEFPVWNRAKIYQDAYRQIISAGQRYPDAQRELDLRMNLGALFISFVGHGGESGWTSERILGMNQIDALNNTHSLPLYYTATCTFTRFDDPNLRSGGERLLEMKNGGAIGLISTTRPTSIIGTFNKNIIRNLYQYTDVSNMPRLGDILLKSKNQFGGTYPLMLLFGDPSMRLAYPEHVVKATNISIHGNPSDTIIKATDLVTVSGVVENRDGQLHQNFNGRIYVTFFDKPTTQSTLQNDPPAKKLHFQVERSIVFRGQGLVKDGQWSVTFKVPIDINYALGKAKMSLYAENGKTDAHGFQEFWIGGSAENCTNQEGPQLSIFLNDTLYTSGAIAGTHVAVYVQASDPDGINTTGTGIGHDLLAILEGTENKSYILNEYFNYDLGSYTSGHATLPLGDLPDGNYVLRVIAWDNCNNPSDAKISFKVDKSRLILNDLFAFPNPTSEGVTFSFNHNLAGKNLNATLRIFDIQGRLMYAREQVIQSSGYRNIDLQWDCSTYGGNRLAPGIYPFTLQISDEYGRSASASAKLIIL